MDAGQLSKKIIRLYMFKTLKDELNIFITILLRVRKNYKNF